MDNKLFEIFSGKTEVPEIVTDRIEAALNKFRNSSRISEEIKLLPSLSRAEAVNADVS